jgi:RNA polymerase sigma-70 factor (ECF subfamily)
LLEWLTKCNSKGTGVPQHGQSRQGVPKEATKKSPEVTMASSIQQAKLAGFAVRFPGIARTEQLEFQECYEANRHRVYALAFWMTDNEISAEEVMRNVFLRVFASSQQPSAELVDRALMSELREISPLGTLTLECACATFVLGVRHNIKRTDLERAVVQVPRTERLVFLLHDVERYDHRQIAKLLGLSAAESQQALHQARLRVRELISRMY